MQEFVWNNLSLNLSKTKFIILGKRVTLFRSKLMISDVEFEGVTSLILRLYFHTLFTVSKCGQIQNEMEVNYYKYLSTVLE